jgi:hypothetical protein
MATDREALLLQMSADIRGLEKQFAKAQGIVDKGSRAMERRAQSASTTLERFFGKTDPAKGLDKVFDATRFKILDSGIARVGLFGSALESLGPAGLVAAAGIGAVGAAFAQSREAARFADDIADTADRLHVTTDALQEFRYAIRLAGGDEKGADLALERFSETLGKAQAGIARGLRGFQALGFTKEQIKGFTDVETTLPKIAAAMQGLSDAQKDAALSLLGLEGLKQLLEKGPDDMARLRREAHALGIVMDRDLVARGADLNDRFETVSKVIDVQLKSALVDLGPVLVGLLQQMADLARLAADVADAFRKIEDKRTDHLKRLRDDFEKQANGPLGFLYGPAARKKIAEIDAELATRSAAGSGSPPPIRPTRTLTDLSGASRPKGPNVSPIEEILPIDPATGRAVRPASAEDLAARALGFLGDEDVLRAGLEKPVTIDLDFKPSLDESGWAESRAQLRQDVEDAWSEGLRAAMNGDFWGFITNNLENAAIQGLARFLAQHTPGAGGGPAGLLSSVVLTALGVPGFASGTSYAPSGLAVVGERGPELVKLPQGAQVYPSHQLTNAVRAAPVTQQLAFDLRGAVMTEDLLRQMQRIGAQAAIHGATGGHLKTMKSLAQRSRGRLGR